MTKPLTRKEAAGILRQGPNWDSGNDRWRFKEALQAIAEGEHRVGPVAEHPGYAPPIDLALREARQWLMQQSEVAPRFTSTAEQRHIQVLLSATSRADKGNDAPQPVGGWQWVREALEEAIAIRREDVNPETVARWREALASLPEQPK